VKSGRCKRVFGSFYCYKDALFCTEKSEPSEQLSIVTSLDWKRLEPFYEELRSGNELWGFRLLGANTCEDFYTNSEADQ
jgi:hypothetical protein